MKASDLRIGNIVNVFRQPTDREMTAFPVEEIYTWEDKGVFDVEVDNGFVVNLDSGVEPIPTTEQWLKDFGFKNRGNYWMKPNSNFWFGITLNKNNIHFVHFDTEEGHINIDLSYIHKLQNFFFAVTGEELKRNCIRYVACK